ncbi:MAG: hypothetical protein R6U20_12820 [Longimonas sp.]|uniref:hypothetical protein n=1 Tax=Longimonas sp. TaxID=2039626 RepID=UPI003975F48C
MGLFAREEVTILDTPYGMFTSNGLWFHVREDDVRTYAADVLEHVSLETLVAYAWRWMHSPQTLAVWLLPVLLVALGPVAAFACMLGAYLGGKAFCPALVSWKAMGALHVLNQPVIQGLFYVVALSYLAAGDQLAAVGTGLAGFVLLRWGLLRWATDPIVRMLWRGLYRLPVADQVLRAVIVRAARHYGASLEQIDQMLGDIIRHWTARADDMDDVRPPPDTPPHESSSS